jgi:hypothetical protein
VGFAKELCSLIDRNIVQARAVSPFLRKVDNATVKVSELVRYLFGTRYLLSHTPGHLRLAIERAEHQELKDYLVEHLDEEVGHDQWAENDIKMLAKIAHFAFKRYVSPSMVRHVSWIEHELIRKDPWLYPPYILAAEYLAVSAGPWFMERLKAAGIPAKGVSVVRNHVELDVRHIQQDYQIIDRFIDRNPDWKERYTQVVERAMENYLLFLDDLVAAG